MRERLGRLDGLTYAWLGDGNNMAHSWLEAAACPGAGSSNLACPRGRSSCPDPEIVAYARARGAQRSAWATTRRPEAVAGAQVVNTDVWASMGQEERGRPAPPGL